MEMSQIGEQAFLDRRSGVRDAPAIHVQRKAIFSQLIPRIANSRFTVTKPLG